MCILHHSTAQEIGEKLSVASEQLEMENKELGGKLEEVKVELDGLKHTSQELAKQEVSVSTTWRC